MKKIRVLFLMFAVLFSSLVIFPTSNASAATNPDIIDRADDVDADNDMVIVLCNILNFVRGGVGRTIAAFIIIGIGIGFFTGKTNWGLLIGVTLGISAMFGAPAIINAVTGGSNNLCDTTNA